MGSSKEIWTEEEKAFLKGASIGFTIGASAAVIATTILFLFIGLYY